MSRGRFTLVGGALVPVIAALVISSYPVHAHSVAAQMSAGGPMMGPQHTITRPSFVGYYDGHKDTYLNTDVSNKADAKAMHINYSAALGGMHGVPAIYLVEGKAVAHQLAVFGSEPGQSDYSPLWQEFTVTWKAGSKPVLLVRDDQIKALAKKGKLTLKETSVVLNCPIIKVAK